MKSKSTLVFIILMAVTMSLTDRQKVQFQDFKAYYGQDAEEIFDKSCQNYTYLENPEQALAEGQTSPNPRNVKFNCTNCLNFIDGENKYTKRTPLQAVIQVNGNLVHRCIRDDFWTPGCVKYAQVHDEPYPYHYNHTLLNGEKRYSSVLKQYDQKNGYIYTCIQCPAPNVQVDVRLINYTLGYFNMLTVVVAGGGQKFSNKVINFSNTTMNGSFTSCQSTDNETINRQIELCRGRLTSTCTQYPIGQMDFKTFINDPKNPFILYYFKFDETVTCNCSFEGLFQTANPNISECADEVPNCAVYDLDGPCIQCSIEYSFKQGKCEECSSGYRKSIEQTGVCVAEIPHCISYENDLTCIDCEQFYEDSALCDSCVAGYRSSSVPGSDACVLLITYCTQYDETDKCTECSEGDRRVSNVNGQCLDLIPKCTGYDQADQCTECEQSFRLANDQSSAQSCIAKQQNCQDDSTAYDSSDKCQECANSDEYRVSSLASVKDCVLRVPNCAQYAADDSCEECTERFFISQVNPGTCNERVLNCLNQIYGSDDLCVECEEGYRKSAGLCQLKVPNCATYNNKNECIGCIETYRLANAENSEQVCITEVTNCERGNDQAYDSNDKCVLCINGFRKSDDPNNKECLERVENCEVYKNDVCIQCNGGYFVSQKKTNTCAQNVKYCLENAYDNNDHCTKCIQNFDLETDTSTGVKYCEGPVENCATYLGVTCIRCNNGFRFGDAVNGESQLCFKETEGCKFYSGQRCCECQEGFILNGLKNYTCVIEPGCIKSGFGSCILCRYPWYQDIAINGKCIRNNTYLLNCQTRAINAQTNLQTGTKECSKCRQGYILNAIGDGCVKGSVPNCKIYQQTNPQLCQECFSQSYALVDGGRGCALLDDDLDNLQYQCPTYGRQTDEDSESHQHADDWWTNFWNHLFGIK